MTDTYDAFADFVDSDAYQQRLADRLPPALPLAGTPPDDVRAGNDSEPVSLGESWGLTPEQVGLIEAFTADKVGKILRLPEANASWIPLFQPDDAYYAVALARYLGEMLNTQMEKDPDTDGYEMAVYAVFFFLTYYNWNGDINGDES